MLKTRFHSLTNRLTLLVTDNRCACAAFSGSSVTVYYEIFSMVAANIFLSLN